METPVLNKKQTKLSLSAKKNRPKEIIKNVLASPFDKNFWPQISQEDNEFLHKVLHTNLPRIKEDKVNVPWDELKKVPKSERKTFRADYTKRVTAQNIDQDKSSSLALGVNSVTKQLENNSASIVLITSDVMPKVMVQHLIDMAVLQKIPILVIDHLRILLKTNCGISSVAVAIHKKIHRESKLNIINDSVHEIFMKYPVPENHINYKRSTDISSQIHLQPIVTKDEPKVEVDENVIREIMHLKCQNKKSRAFIPELSKIDRKISRLEVHGTDFLAFSDDPVEEKSQKHYKSLIVKRLKGDKNRNKRKINDRGMK